MIARYCRIEEECGEQGTTTHRVRAVMVYHEPSLSGRALAYLSNSLSGSFFVLPSKVRVCEKGQRTTRLEVPHKGSSGAVTGIDQHVRRSKMGKVRRGSFPISMAYVTVTVIDISAETTTGQTTDTEGGVEAITVHSELVIGAGD